MRIYLTNSKFYHGTPIDLTPKTSSSSNGYYYINKGDTRVEFIWTHKFTSGGAFRSDHNDVTKTWISGYGVGITEVRLQSAGLILNVPHPPQLPRPRLLSNIVSSPFHIHLLQAAFSIYRSSQTPRYDWKVARNAPTRDAPHTSPVEEMKATFEPHQIGISHGRIVYFQHRVSNGGYRDVSHLKYQNSASRYRTRTYFSGRSVYTNMYIVYDFVPPYQPSTAIQLFITAPDLFSGTTQNGLSTSRSFVVNFAPYRDDNSPVAFYEIEACPMKRGVPVLTEQRGARSDGSEYCLDLAIYKKSDPHSHGNQPVPGPKTWTVTNEGDVATLWSFVLVVKDAADNVRKARRLILVDQNPRVAVSERKAVLVTSAGEQGTVPFEARELWQTSNAGLTATWDGVLNDHRTAHWLKATTREGVSDLTAGYDQPAGTKINVLGTPNEDGIVTFHTYLECLDCDFTPDGDADAVKAALAKAAPLPRDPATSRPPLHQTLATELQNGHHYRFHVRGDNVFGASAHQASIPFGVDVTQPDVTDFHVVNDEEPGLTAHSLNDLQHMQLVFRATDPESGLRHIDWDLYAHQQLNPGAQESTTLVADASVDVSPVDDVAACTAHGKHACVCNAFSGTYCYLRDYVFPVERHLVLADSELDRHGRNFTFHLRVTNRAGLVTTLTREIIVDVTPPDATAAAVHEGPGGEGAPDADFVQDSSIPIRFEGFVDHESGIRAFYWSAGPVCARDRALEAIEAGNFTRANDSSAVFHAPRPGRYIITAIAYNGAWEPSVPVCSDGVVYDPTPATLEELRIDDLGAEPGLIRLGDAEVLVVYANLTSARVVGPGADCVQQAHPLRSVPAALFPPAYTNASVPASDACAAYAPFREQFILSVANVVNVSWRPTHDPSTIHTYALALSSSPDADQGDLMPFKSTNKQPGALLVGEGAEDGSVFFLLLRVIKKNKQVAIFRVGPVVVDSAAPLLGNTASPGDGGGGGAALNKTGMTAAPAQIAVAVTQHRFTLEARWPVAQPVQQSTTDSKALYYRIGVGRPGGQSPPDILLPFRQALADEPSYDGAAPGAVTGNCNGAGLSSTPCARLPTSSLRGLGPFIVVVEACAGPGRCLLLQSEPQVALPSAAPHPGVVLEGEVEPQTITQVAQPGAAAAFVANRDWEPEAADADVQLGSHALSVRWHSFDTEAEGVVYELGVGSNPGLDDIVTFAPVQVRQQALDGTPARGGASPPLQAFIPLALEAGRRYYPAVRAVNAVGHVTVSSDGIVYVPLAATPPLSVDLGRPAGPAAGTNVLQSSVSAHATLGDISGGGSSTILDVTFQPGQRYVGTLVFARDGNTRSPAVVSLRLGAYAALVALGEPGLADRDRCCCWLQASPGGSAAENATVADGGEPTCAPGAQAVGILLQSSACACPEDMGQSKVVMALSLDQPLEFEAMATAPEMEIQVRAWPGSGYEGGSPAEDAIRVTLLTLQPHYSQATTVHVDAAGMTRGPVEAAWAFLTAKEYVVSVAARQSVTHFEWTVGLLQLGEAACPSSATWPANQPVNLSAACAPRLLRPFVPVGHVFAAHSLGPVSLSATGVNDPGDEDAALIALVRPCHTAGCFAPSTSAVVPITTAVGPQPDGKPSLVYHQGLDNEGSTDAVVTFAPFEYAGGVTLYQWTLAHHPSGSGQLVDWQTVPRAAVDAAADAALGSRDISAYAHLPRDLSLFDARSIYVVVRAYGSDGSEGRACIWAGPRRNATAAKVSGGRAGCGGRRRRPHPVAGGRRNGGGRHCRCAGAAGDISAGRPCVRCHQRRCFRCAMAALVAALQRCLVRLVRGGDSQLPCV